MARHKLYGYEPHFLRAKIRRARELADGIHQQEKDFVALMGEFDKHRYFTRLGFRSLRSFCCIGLQFTRTQAQRIVTLVRRADGSLDENSKSESRLQSGQ